MLWESKQAIFYTETRSQKFVSLPSGVHQTGMLCILQKACWCSSGFKTRRNRGVMSKERLTLLEHVLFWRMTWFFLLLLPVSCALLGSRRNGQIPVKIIIGQICLMALL